MPKDLIHFTIAEHTASRLHDTPYAPFLKSNRCGLLLGSVFHDALFYAVLPGGNHLESLAHTFHGTKGEDSFDLVRMQVEHVLKSNEKSLPTALLVGMVSHLFADVTMHPMVWHFTGDYYDNDRDSKSLARQRHRALESLMDMVACPDKVGNPDYGLRTLLRATPGLVETGLPMNELGFKARIPHANAQKHTNAAWSLFAMLQTVFPVRWLARSLWNLRNTMPDSAAEVAALFYAPQLLHQADRLRGRFTFIHPVTGESNTTSLNELMNTAAERAATFCRDIGPVIFDGAQLDIPHGPSLETGGVGEATSTMRHFATPPYPDLS